MATSIGPKMSQISLKIQQYAVSHEQNIFWPLGVFITNPPTVEYFSREFFFWTSGRQEQTLSQSQGHQCQFFQIPPNPTQIVCNLSAKSLGSQGQRKRQTYAILRVQLVSVRLSGHNDHGLQKLRELEVAYQVRKLVFNIFWDLSTVKENVSPKKTGFISILAFESIEITAVECPIQVQVILLSSD